MVCVLLFTHEERHTHTKTNTNTHICIYTEVKRNENIIE